MKIYYGYDDKHYRDITGRVLVSCLKDDGIFIPADENERVQVAGGDPYPGILKHILILDDNNKRHIFNHMQSVYISIPSISAQLSKLDNLKKWWDETGRHLGVAETKLKGIHSRVQLLHGTMNDEMVEQTMAASYIRPDARVLELGGNIGRNSIVISTILNNSSNLVVMESDPAIADLLKQNLDNNDVNCHVVAAALSKRHLIQRGWDTVPIAAEDGVPDGWKEIPTITFDELMTKYQIEFDTLVADCEGALYYILLDEPSILNNIKLIIMENDYHVLEHKLYVNHLLEVQGFKRVFFQPGGWGPCSEFFWEVWERA